MSPFIFEYLICCPTLNTMLRSIVCSIARNRVANLIACHGSAELAGMSMGMGFLWESHGKRPMGWDRHKLLWGGNGTDKYVPWTTLGLSMGVSFPWETSHGMGQDRHKLLWDGNGTDKYAPWTTLQTRILEQELDYPRPFRRWSRTSVGYTRRVFPSVDHSPRAYLMHYPFTVETPAQIYTSNRLNIRAALVLCLRAFGRVGLRKCGARLETLLRAY